MLLICSFFSTHFCTECFIIHDSSSAPSSQFPVKVTAKKSGKKVSKTYTCKVTVKNPALTLKAANEVAVGATEQITATVKPAGTKVTYTTSDATIATVDEKGVVTGVKDGEVTITAKAGKTTKTVKMTVKKYVVKSVKQTKANALEAVVIGKTSDIKPADVKITNSVNNNVIVAKEVSVDKADATKVTITTFADMKDAAKYTVELAGNTTEFTATDGVIVDVNVTPVTIAANTKGTEIKGQTLAKDGVVIDEFTTTHPADKTELTLTTNQGYVDGDKLVLPTAGNKGTAEVKYHTYKFDDKGNEVGAYTKKVEITAVAEDAIVTNNFALTITGENDKADWNKTNNQISASDTKKVAQFLFKGSDGKEIADADYAKYSVASTDNTVLLLNQTALTASKKITLVPIKEGSVYINILKDGKVVKTLPVVVTATRKLSNVTLSDNALVVSNTAENYTTGTITVKAFDQYGAEMNIDPSNVSVSKKNGKSSIDFTPVDDGNYVKVNAELKDKTEDTNTIQVEVTVGNDKVSRYYTVKSVKTETVAAKSTDWRMTLNGVTDGKVDMKVADDADASSAVKNVKPVIAVYDKGAKIGEVTANVTFSVDNGAKINDDTISVVSNVAGVYEKNLESGKTYTVTAVATYVPDGKTDEVKKTFKQSFSVVDTQAAASVKINSTKVSAKVGLSDPESVLANTCKASYGDKTDITSFVVKDGDYKKSANGTADALYISKAYVKVQSTKDSSVYFLVPVTINTTFTIE